MLSSLWPTRPARFAAAGLVSAALALLLFVVRQAEWAGLISGRLAKGKKPRLEDFVLEGQWHAALLSVGLCLGLAVTARYWLAPAAVLRKPCGGSPARRWWFWPAVLALVAAAAWVRVPRLSHSLYNDEAYAFRRYVAGEHKPLPDGGTQWRPVTWLTTLWGNQMANNGVPYSLTSRAAYDVAVARGWATATLPAEMPLRLPAFLAGLGSVAVIALLARRLGGSGAGVAAALLAAVHPWHVRYSTEARAHGFILLLAPLLPLVLVRAAETGRWRWWLGFGATELVMLWSFAGSVHYLLAFNFLALIWLWREGGGSWKPFLAVHVMAAMVYLHLMGPCFPQIREALADNRVFSSGVGSGWWAATGSFLLAGMPWANANPEVASHPSMSGLWSSHPVGAALLVVAGAAVFAAGWRRSWSDPLGRVLVLTLPLAIAFAVAATLVGRTVLLTWYVLYLLPVGLAIAGLGLAELVEHGHRRGRTEAWAALASVVLILSVWGWAIYGPLSTYRKMGKQALRDVAQYLRAPIDGVVPLAALHASEAVVYDPALLVIAADPARLEALGAQADAEGRPLLVAFGYRPSVEKATPEFLRFIEFSGEFERVATFPGLEEPQFAHHVWRRRPKVAADR